MSIYVGCKGGKREVFLSKSVPTETSHGDQYNAVIGPFRTLKAAVLMRDSGYNNPHMQHVDDAERIARHGYAKRLTV